MVAIDDGHDHDDGELCPRCRLIERVAEYVTAAAAAIGRPVGNHGLRIESMVRGGLVSISPCVPTARLCKKPAAAVAAAGKYAEIVAALSEGQTYTAADIKRIVRTGSIVPSNFIRWCMANGVLSVASERQDAAYAITAAGREELRKQLEAEGGAA